MGIELSSSVVHGWKTVVRRQDRDRLSTKNGISLLVSSRSAFILAECPPHCSGAVSLVRTPGLPGPGKGNSIRVSCASGSLGASGET